MVRRRPLFQEDPLIILLTLGRYVMPPDKVEVEPCFVVAALIGRAQAQDFMSEWRKHHEAVLSCAGIGFWRFKEQTDVSPVARGQEGIGKAQSAEASSMVLTLFLLSDRHAAPLKSLVTRSTFSSSIIARIVWMSFFPVPRFLP